MAKAESNPSRKCKAGKSRPSEWPRLSDDPSKIGPPNLLEFEIAFQQLPPEHALDDLNDLVRRGRCAFRLVYPDGKEIGGEADARQMELRVEMDANGVDHIAVYPSGYRPPINSGEPDYLDGRVTFFALAKDIKQLCPTATAALPLSPGKEPAAPPPSKKPTLTSAAKKKRRKVKSAPIKARRRGPKAKIAPRIIGAMKNDISQGRLSLAELEAMSDKELEGKYPAKRERVRTARQSVIEHYRQLPTIADKK